MMAPRPGIHSVGYERSGWSSNNQGSYSYLTLDSRSTSILGGNSIVPNATDNDIRAPRVDSDEGPRVAPRWNELRPNKAILDQLYTAGIAHSYKVK